MQVTLEGWIWERSVSATARDGFDLVVSASSGENLRAAPNGEVVARAETGLLFERVGSRPGWVQVQRTGWMWGRSLEPVGALPPVEEPDAEEPDTIEVSLEHAVLAQEATMHRLPDGDTAGVLLAELPVRIVARSDDWVRVQTEGWVRAENVRSATAGVLIGVTGAEVRSRPAEYEGKSVHWTVQVISVQEADELRPEVPLGRPYVLARGPLPEAGFLYIIVNDEQRREIERLAPLAAIEIVARVRVARTQYLGNLVVELEDFATR